MTVDTNKYLDFVTEVTSLPSTDLAALLSRITELDIENDADVPRLLTAALGLTAESGEFYTLIRCCSDNFFSYSTILSDSKLKSLLSAHRSPSLRFSDL